MKNDEQCIAKTVKFTISTIVHQREIQQNYRYTVDQRSRKWPFTVGCCFSLLLSPHLTCSFTSYSESAATYFFKARLKYSTKCTTIKPSSAQSTQLSLHIKSWRWSFWKTWNCWKNLLFHPHMSWNRWSMSQISQCVSYNGVASLLKMQYSEWCWWWWRLANKWGSSQEEPMSWKARRLRRLYSSWYICCKLVWLDRFQC